MRPASVDTLSKMATDRSVTVGSVDVQPTDIVRNLGVRAARQRTDNEASCQQSYQRMFLPSASAETAETSRVSGHTAAACLSLHLKPVGQLQLTSLRTAVVDHRSP